MNWNNIKREVLEWALFLGPIILNGIAGFFLAYVFLEHGLVMQIFSIVTLWFSLELYFHARLLMLKFRGEIAIVTKPKKGKTT